MKISYNWLQTYFEKPLPSPAKLEELFIFRACEVEGVEEVKDVNGKVTDTVLDLKVLPDRAHYALCHKGIVGEVYSLTGIPQVSKMPAKIDESTDKKPSITIETPGFCRRYIGRYVDIAGVGLAGGSQAPIVNLLESIGQHAINPIVDATNFVMFDIGQPLHAFDADKVKGGIVVRKAKRGEKITLLDSSVVRPFQGSSSLRETPQGGIGRDLYPEAGAREIELTEQDHVIADDEGPLAIAGVKGGKRAAITEKTTKIILESANFEPTAVRKTSTKYDLRSESSKRYENEITPEIAIDGMNELSLHISRAIPDAKFGPIVDVYPTKAVQTVIEMDPRYVSERLGVDVPHEIAEKILEGMGISVESRKSKVESQSQWKLTIPFNRLDLTIPDDIVEEVGRIFGYEHIVGILPPKPETEMRVLPSFYLGEMIKNILTLQGFSEVSLYSLVAKGEIETAKPLAKDKAFARPTLREGMISCVEKNVLNADLIGLDSIKIFEIGHVFGNAGESIHLSIGAAQVRKVKGVNGKKLIDGMVQTLGKELGVDINVQYPVPDGRQATLNVQEKGNISVCEINLDELLKVYKLPANASYDDLGFGPASTNVYKKISQYPFMVRDIAVFVPEDVSADQVWDAIQGGIQNEDAPRLLVRHSLFDTFKKDGKVSYAFRMVFQSMERTLTDDEVLKIMTSINNVLKGKGWEVR